MDSRCFLQQVIDNNVSTEKEDLTVMSTGLRGLIGNIFALSESEAD